MMDNNQMVLFQMGKQQGIILHQSQARIIGAIMLSHMISQMLEFI